VVEVGGGVDDVDGAVAGLDCGDEGASGGSGMKG
jgi:hypothetical protein